MISCVQPMILPLQIKFSKHSSCLANQLLCWLSYQHTWNILPALWTPAGLCGELPRRWPSLQSSHWLCLNSLVAWETKSSVLQRQWNPCSPVQCGGRIYLSFLQTLREGSNGPQEGGGHI